MEYFRMPTKICMGKGSLKELSNIDSEYVFIICDPFMKTSNKLNLVTELLENRNIPYKFFDKVIPDPTLEVVAEAIKDIDDKTDTIIALGGGSAIDTAKVVRKVFENITSKETKFIAIPTTSGTGSELTSFAVVSDTSTKTKIPIVDFSMLPDTAILDCEFTLSVPPNITADTGIDVLTHALEAFASTKANDFTDACAEKAIELVFKYLKRAVDDGDDYEARMHLHNASAMAGIAFNEASLGVCHSLAHALGGYFHIAHGRSNALLLSHVLEYNTYSTDDNVKTIKKYAELAKSLGFGSYDDKASVKCLVRQVKNLISSIGIPLYVDELLDINEYIGAIDEMASKALVDKCSITNPRIPTHKDFEDIYNKLIKRRFI